MPNAPLTSRCHLNVEHLVRRVLAVFCLAAGLTLPASGQANNTGGAGWDVNVFTVLSGTSSGFYTALNPSGGEPGVWQDNNASTEWISAWSNFSTSPGAGDYNRTNDANARYHYTYRYTFAQPLGAGSIAFAAGWDNIFKGISWAAGGGPSGGLPTNYLVGPLPERSIADYFGFCRTGDAMHNTGDGDCTAKFVVPVVAGTEWMAFEVWGDGQTDGFWLEWDQSSIPQETVPEPATMTLLATGLAAMSGMSLRRRKRRTAAED